MIAYEIVLTTVFMNDFSKPNIGSNEKNINNDTAIHVSTWSRTILGACLHIFMFKNTDLFTFSYTILYRWGTILCH
jgi:hypothetical protein